MNVLQFAQKAGLRFFLALASILFPTTAFAQSSLSDVIGLPPDAAMYPIPGLGSVNLNNGNLRLDIPIHTVKDRNGTPITTSITYDSSDWFVATFGTGPNNFPTYYWDVAATPLGLFYPGSNIWYSSLGTSTGRKNAGSVTYTTSTLVCGSGGTTSQTNQYSNWQFKDEQGTIHIFYPNLTTMQPNSACSGLSSSFQASAMDGSGYWLEVTNSTNWVVSDIHGNFVANGSEDTNGNISGVTTDALGRSTSLPAGFTSTFKTIHVWTKFGNSTVGELGPLSAQVLDTLTLPDGRTYSFQYDDAGTPQGANGTYLSTQQGHYGSVTGITLPTGGQVTINSGPLSLVIGQNPNSIYYPSAMVVNSITTPDGTWNFDYSSTAYKITATAPPDPLTGLSSQTVNLCGVYGCNTYSQVSVYAGAATVGTPLRQVTKQYSSTSFGPSSITTKLDNGQSSTVAYTYADTCTPRIATKKEYDFSGNLARETDVTYLTTPSDNTNLCSLVANKPAFTDPYLQNGHHIVDIPSSVTVYGPGGPTSTAVAQTNYTYDSTTLSTTSGSAGTSVLGLTTHDDANYGSGMTYRGNPTVISQMVSPGVFITAKTLTYNILGEVVKSVDGNGNATTFDYTDSWNDASCIPTTSPEFAYPTTITNAVNRKSTFTYNSCDGSVASAKDQNDITANRAGTVYTYDGLQRPTKVASPDGGNTGITYGGSAIPEVITTTITASPSPAQVSTTTLDALGRTSKTVGPDGATVDTAYDSLGRVLTVSNPYFSSSDPQYLTTYTYDALGRTTIVTKPDGSKKQYCYNNQLTTGQTNCSSHSAGTGTWIDVADENGNDWWSTSDALGRLTTVFEPSGASKLPTLETDYLYDTLGNLTSVSQKGVSGIETARTTRSFGYDSLSRLTSAFNPESGSVNYIYDSNGNVHTKTDARGIVTTYTYDALNRVVAKTYSDGTPSSCYRYDVSASNGTATNESGRLTGEWTQTGSCPALSVLKIPTSAITAEAFPQYDAVGRLLQEKYCTLQDCTFGNVVTAGYDKAGAMTSLVYPYGRKISLGIDSAGRTNSVNYASWNGISVGTTYLGVNAYDPFGHPTSSTFATSVTATASYNPLGELASLSYANPVATLWNKNFVWTLNGNLQFASDQISGTTRQYGYDTLNRLVSAQDIVGMVSGGDQTGDTAGQTPSDLLQDYQALGTAGWGAGNATLAMNATDAPDGSMTAGTITGNAISSYATDNVPNPALYEGAPITASVWLRARGLASGATQNVSLSIPTTVEVGTTTGAPLAGSGTAAVTSSWQQFQFSGVAPNNLRVMLLKIGGDNTIGTGQTIDVWEPSIRVASTNSTVTNILPYSQQVGDPSTTWSPYCPVNNSSNMTLNATDFAAPDNSLTATKFVLPGGTLTCGSGGTMGAFDTIPGGLVAGQTYTASVWLRGNSGGEVVAFGLNDCAWGNVTLSTAWQRFTVTYSSISSAISGCGTGARGFQVADNSYPGATYYVWGAQVETSPTEGPYVATLDTPITVDADGTNGLPSSSQVGGTGWSISGGTSSANTTTMPAPDGSTTADAVTAGATTPAVLKDFAATPTLYDGATVTASVYLSVPVGTTLNGLNISLVNVTTSGSTSTTTQTVNLTRAWQRVQVTTSALQNGLGQLYLQIGGGSTFPANQIIYVWGAEMVMGSSAGAPVQTAGTTANGATGASVYLVPNGLNESYNYDSFGNLQQSGNFPFQQSYNAANQLTGWSYDASGNLLIDNLKNGYAYDAEGRISAMGSYVVGSGGTYTFTPNVNYAYDAEGNRVSKSGSPATDHIYFGGRELARLAGGQWTDLIYGSSGLLAEVPGTQSGAPVYRLTDHLGSSVGTVDSDGAPLSSSDYAPFGQLFTGVSTDPYKFTGKERDAESGLDYFGARYYASSMGRFMSPDPSQLYYANPTNPQSFNLYSYALNNPLRFVDPNGLYCAWEDGTSDDDPSDGGIDNNPTDGCEAQGGHWTPESNPCHGADGCVATFDWNPPLHTQNASLGNYYYFGSFSGPMTPSNVKKGFFDTQSKLFAGCLADNAGKAKLPQQTAANSPKINAAKNSHQLQAMAKVPFGVQGFHDYPLSSQGTIYIASDTFNTGGANQVFANYGTYAHELADMVSGQATGDEESFGDPPNDVNGGDTDSGAAVEACMYETLQRP